MCCIVIDRVDNNHTDGTVPCTIKQSQRAPCLEFKSLINFNSTSHAMTIVNAKVIISTEWR